MIDPFEIRITSKCFKTQSMNAPPPFEMQPGDYQISQDHMRAMCADGTMSVWVDFSPSKGGEPVVSFPGYTPPQRAAHSVCQDWVLERTLMQQSVLFGIVRGPDGVEKYHPVKPVLRWYRRCLLLSALDGEVIDNPTDKRGGSFTGASFDYDGDHTVVRWEETMDRKVDDFMRTMDQMPIHFFLHMMHAVEIMGYKHSNLRIRAWWNGVYNRMVEAMHVWPETEEQMDQRLGDSREGWMARSDAAITK